MIKQTIKFGTSGWRAIMADEFTFDNLRRVVNAIAEVILEANGNEPRLFVGYDTRFLSDRFADASAAVLAGRGIRAVVSETHIPTPAVAHTVREFGFDGAINITASHNPAEYNGLKFSTAAGAPAPLEVTKKIEEKVAAGGEASAVATTGETGEMITRADHRDAYYAQLARHVNFDAIVAPRQDHQTIRETLSAQDLKRNGMIIRIGHASGGDVDTIRLHPNLHAQPTMAVGVANPERFAIRQRHARRQPLAIQRFFDMPGQPPPRHPFEVGGRRTGR